MSATTKKKHVTKEVLEEFPLPRGTRQVVRVTASRGNNLHEVETAHGETFLVSMPTKFRKHVWIKRGDYILVDPISEGGKVKAEISHILFREQIRHIQDNNLWPEAFSDKTAQQVESTIPPDLLPPSDSEDSDEDLADLVINLNRVNVVEEVDHSDDDEDENDDDDENDNDDNKDDDGEEKEAESHEKADVNSAVETKPVINAVNTPGITVHSEDAT